MRLAVIPARGGSKRIPRKNIKLFAGKPMIAWSIEAAKKSECFDRIIVSTDDEEIARESLSLGAEVPYIRPAELADDHTTTIPVISHAIRQERKLGNDPVEVCCIYATAPFISPDDLQKGLDLLQRTSSNYTVPIVSYPFPIQRAVRVTRANNVEMIERKYSDIRSQDLEEAYHDAGQFYWGMADAWLDEEPIFSSNSVPVILPRHRVQDIDTLEDWVCAELMFAAIVKRD